MKQRNLKAMSLSTLLSKLPSQIICLILITDFSPVTAALIRYVDLGSPDKVLRRSIHNIDFTCRAISLNALRPRARRGRPRGDVFVGYLRLTPVDFD
jgi:hypothetical protein